MWQALENVAALVRPQGRLFISIYNDQGSTSRRWKALKKFYNDSSKPVQWMVVLGVGVFWEVRAGLTRLVQLGNPLPFKYWAERKRSRGMSVWHDLVDWVGGYPFEVAKPEEVFNFYYKNGFELLKLKTCGGGLGCNEFVFVRKPNHR